MIDQRAIDCYWASLSPRFERPNWALLKRAFELGGITRGRPPRRRKYEGYYQEEPIQRLETIDKTEVAAKVAAQVALTILARTRPKAKPELAPPPDPIGPPKKAPAKRRTINFQETKNGK